MTHDDIDPLDIPRNRSSVPIQQERFAVDLDNNNPGALLVKNSDGRDSDGGMRERRRTWVNLKPIRVCPVFPNLKCAGGRGETSGTIFSYDFRPSATGLHFNARLFSPTPSIAVLESRLLPLLLSVGRVFQRSR